MDEKELKENAERYCELLIVYDNMLQVLEKVTQKITETKKELVYLEGVLQENGATIKDVEIEKCLMDLLIFLDNLIKLMIIFKTATI